MRHIAGRVPLQLSLVIAGQRCCPAGITPLEEAHNKRYAFQA